MTKPQDPKLGVFVIEKVANRIQILYHSALGGCMTDVGFFYFVSLRRDGGVYSGPFHLWNSSGSISELNIRIQVFEQEESLGLEMYMGAGKKVWPTDTMDEEQLEALANQGHPLSNLAMVVLYYLEKVLEKTDGQLLDSELCAEAGGDFTLDLSSARAIQTLFSKREVN